MTPVHLPAIEKWSPVPLSYSGVERVRRIELRCLDWRSNAQPIGHTRSGTTSVMLFSCQRPASRYTPTESLLGQSELDKMPQITDKTKKAGGPFLVAARFLKPYVIPRRSGHPARIMIHAPLRTFDFDRELEYLSHAA